MNALELHKNNFKKEALSIPQIWERVCTKFSTSEGSAIFNSWLKPLSLSSVENGFVVLTSPSRFIKDWVFANYNYLLSKIFAEEISGFKALDIIISKPQVNNAAQAISQADKNSVQNVQQALDLKIETKANKFSDLLINKLDSKFSFESFIAGEGSILAFNAAAKIADDKNDCEGISPLFIHAKVGSGKTHLLQAVASKAIKLNSYKSILYLSAEKFMFSYVRALKENSMIDFKDFVRSSDLLIMDDIQFICGKQNFQEEFIHTVNAVIDAGGKVILSADRAPSQMEGLDDRIKSRLAGGLIADIKPYTSEDRFNILNTKAVLSGVNIAENITRFLADSITVSIREAEGALNKLIQISKLTGKQITLELAVATVKSSYASIKKELTLEDIKKLVCQKFSLTQTEIESATRLKKISEARQIAMYLAKKLTTKSFPDIGKFFGGKDHSTVIHAVKKIEKMMNDNPNFNSLIEDLTSSLAV